MLVDCPECRQKISDKTVTCPLCGYPMRLKLRLDATSTKVEIESWLEQQCGYPWRVLAIDRDLNVALAIAKNIVEERAYNQQYAKVDWSTSSLRHYLNNEFYLRLPEEVRQRLVKVGNAATQAEPLGAPWHEDVVDKVFLLSESEAERYFSRLSKDGSLLNEDEHHEEDPLSTKCDDWEEESRSPLEIWQEDPRQYLSSAVDEWEEEYDSAIRAEQEYVENLNYLDLSELDEKDDQWRKKSFWAAEYRGVTSSWWLRSISDRSTDAPVQLFYPYVGTAPVVDRLGVRPAFCLSLGGEIAYEPSSNKVCASQAYAKPLRLP
ncbi:DUF6273 domain-containing protein [Gordonibacter massiliensis (ex Traore et al. 2017)]|uniref:DUF6273 domain-containing protein n=1 Tax=Gordonibacter massiliensis (ex Traore et al. 2017) TaxID=1841863 RepID=UPI001C8BD40D|nr:DUF6273 domain-containing protein [Gordonibacter massiliensis (ex Traore et al. 2017)]MBX9033111.1 hypothetical protein [Gordonibacter massiliensis (ex Traore et al. 2017)]